VKQTKLGQDLIEACDDILNKGKKKMRPSSAKQKGRKFQQEVRDAILYTFDSLHVDDVRSTSMGAGGEDILLSHAARSAFPYSVECKCVERINMWEAVAQAKSNSGDHTPLVAFKKNHHEAWVAIPMSHFMKLVKNDV